jgi:acylpyruvate hydrolase
MLLISYRSRGSSGAWRTGVMEGQSVIDLSASRLGSGNVLSMRSFLSASKQEKDDALAWARTQLASGDNLVTLDQVELGPPVPDPEKILCIGLNYLEHAAESGQDIPVVPTFFGKFRNSLIGPTSPVVLPGAEVSTLIDYEGELAVIIGQRCKSVSKEEALSYVAGYTVCNDVSARNLQMQTSQWTAGKAIDTFAPMGPGIVLAADIPDPQKLKLTTRVNGLVVQNDNTANMIFSVATTISFLSSFMTLEPGDIIATGTPSGVGGKRQPPLFLHAGDLVEVEIEGIGMIANPFVASEESSK